jgi:hypothetical protein
MKTQPAICMTLAALMVGGTVLPAMADDHGQGKKKGHYKNGKAYGNYPGQSWHSDKRWKNRDRDDDDERRNRDWERDHNRSYSNYNNYSTQSELDRLSNRRQQTKNEWRNIAYVSGAVGLLGLLKKDNRLVFAGAAGTLYSLYRYEQDRKSQSSIDRARASYFSRPYFVRDGRRYDRRVVTKGGQRYYQFVRG